MWISVVKCSWVKCSEVLQCSNVLLVPFYHFVYGCKFCILLFNSVSYVFLLLCLCILIEKYALFCILFANWHSPATLTEVFRVFSSVVRQMPGYTLQRRGTTRTLPQLCCSVYCLCRLCCSMYCLCVNVYCTTATGCQPNCS